MKSSSRYAWKAASIFRVSREDGRYAQGLGVPEGRGNTDIGKVMSIDPRT